VAYFCAAQWPTFAPPLTIINLVAEGMGLAFVPNSMRSLSPAGVSYLRLRESAPKIEVGMGWRPDEASEVVRKFVAFVEGEISRPDVKQI